MRPRIPLAWIDQATTRSFTSEMLAIIGPLIPRLSHVTTTRNRFSFEGKRSAPPTVSEEEESCRSARPMPLHMNRLTSSLRASVAGAERLHPRTTKHGECMGVFLLDSVNSGFARHTRHERSCRQNRGENERAKVSERNPRIS